ERIDQRAVDAFNRGDEVGVIGSAWGYPHAALLHLHHWCTVACNDTSARATMGDDFHGAQRFILTLPSCTCTTGARWRATTPVGRDGASTIDRQSYCLRDGGSSTSNAPIIGRSNGSTSHNDARCLSSPFWDRAAATRLPAQL